MEFLLAGASAVMVGTAGFVDPMAWVNTVEGIKAYMQENNVSSVTELIGGHSVIYGGKNYESGIIRVFI